MTSWSLYTATPWFAACKKFQTTINFVFAYASEPHRLPAWLVVVYIWYQHLLLRYWCKADPCMDRVFKENYLAEINYSLSLTWQRGMLCGASKLPQCIGNIITFSGFSFRDPTFSLNSSKWIRRPPRELRFHRAFKRFVWLIVISRHQCHSDSLILVHWRNAITYLPAYPAILIRHWSATPDHCATH